MGHSAARTLLYPVTWNVCWRDEEREETGIAPICWFPEDMTFSQNSPIVAETHRLTLPRGQWYVRIIGDFFHLLQGRVLYEYPNDNLSLEDVTIEPEWTNCEV